MSLNSRYIALCFSGDLSFKYNLSISIFKDCTQLLADVRLKVTGKAKTYWREGGHDPKRYLANEQYLIFEASLLGSRKYSFAGILTRNCSTCKAKT